jgi:hypothetical protein
VIATVSREAPKSVRSQCEHGGKAAHTFAGIVSGIVFGLIAIMTIVLFFRGADSQAGPPVCPTAASGERRDRAL